MCWIARDVGFGQFRFVSLVLGPGILGMLVDVFCRQSTWNKNAAGEQSRRRNTPPPPSSQLPEGQSN
ncbi:hypothetical protein ACSS6W_004627 [Trichoderma asperelloides]